MRLFLIFFFLLAGTSYAALSQTPTGTAVLPDLIVEGKRLRADHRSANVITAAELERQAGRPIGEVLRETVGVDSISGTGGNSSVQIRGASGSQTLVLIDGVKVNDPSATNRIFDWSRIDSSQIERVEILKGPQAVSYGSDAIGGVILIRTKRGASPFTASLEGGSEAFLRARTTLRLPLNSANTLSLQALGKGVFQGRSSALGVPGGLSGNREGDDAKEASVGAELSSDWTSRIRSRIAVDLRAAEEEIDQGAFDDDPNFIARNREIRSSAQVDGEFEGGTAWSFLLSDLDFRRAYSDFIDAEHPFGGYGLYRGRNTRAEVQLHSSPSFAYEWVIGSEATYEKIGMDTLPFPTAISRTEASALAVFAEGVAPLVAGNAQPLLAADFGARLSHFSSYGSQASGKAGLNFSPSEGFESDIGISTGFKAPSLYSLYEPQYGNPGLKPEQAVQIEAGAVYQPEPSLKFSARVFRSRIQNRFGFDPITFRSLNTARAEIHGVELENTTELFPSLRIRPNLTYLDTRGEATGRALNDVPRWKAATTLLWDPSAKSSLELSLLMKSSRSTSAGVNRVAGFSRVDLLARTRIDDRWSATARVENAFDRDYQEIRGYTSAGISGYLGAEFRN